MKNADMPATPIIDSDQAFPLDMERYGSDSINRQFATGMTKREMMAMHFHAALLTASENGLWSGVDANAAYHAVMEADALLAELERTSQKLEQQIC